MDAKIKNVARPLTMKMYYLARLLANCRYLDEALPTIEDAFSGELGARGNNSIIVEIMPEGRKPDLTEFVNTTNKEILYPELKRFCLEKAKEFSKDKQEKINYYLDAFFKWQGKIDGTPEPQQEQTGTEQNPKATRGKGRPKETLKDKMIDDANGQKLQKMHSKLDGKRGKDVSLIILACITKGWLTKPTYTQVKNEFGDIGSKTGYNRYLDSNMYTKEELEGAINSLD